MLFKILQLLIFVQFARPQEFFLFLNPLRLNLLLIFITWVLTILNKNTLSFAETLKLKESKLFMVFFLIMVFGIPFAFHRRFAFDFVIFKYMSNIIFFYVLIANINTMEKVKKALYTVCLSALFLICMSLQKGSFIGGRFDSGTMFDPNDLAYVLVSFLPMFFIFTKKGESVLKRVIAISGILIFTVSILLTGSRGGVLGLGVVLLCILFSKIVVEQQIAKIVLGFFMVVASFMYIDKIDFERFKSITELSSDYNVVSDTGRLAIWKRGMRLVLQNPITGVGVQCFPKAIGEQREDEGVHARWQVAHNSFVEVLVEVGFIGFLYYFLLNLACYKNFKTLAQPQIYEASRESANIPGILLIGFLGGVTCAFFLTQGYSMIFVLYFALSAILRRIYVSESSATS